ncbi:MAG: class I SAM-dependent methyltransferase [Gammaproteobacteria bacterium]|nr:class I SAM-dependent methyltransferase [Gammaproteobacteria bacterium]
MTDTDARRFSPACERNRGPILAALKPRLREARRVLEIASGTGQHAAAFAPELPHLSWQPSDLRASHISIEAWRKSVKATNLLPVIELDLLQPQHRLNLEPVDAIFAANLLHISPPEACPALAEIAAEKLTPGGNLIVYGPFRYPGQTLTPSNQQFVNWLKAQHPRFDIRDKAELDQLMAAEGLTAVDDLTMPANNRLLIWQKPQTAEADIATLAVS